MLRVFNTLGKRIEPFRPADKEVVNIFTCGPSVYQRSHIGNFRTFLFEDILVRYLEYSGYRVARGMNYTDIEDKAIAEASRKGTSVRRLTRDNIKEFIREMRLLRMKIPDYLPKASESVDTAVEIICRLLDRGVAYRHKDDIYFDPLKFPGFGKLYGLDMSRWPKKKIRFHKDTYPGVQWNLGDFILWHRCKGNDNICWDSAIGKGRPSWNIQDPGMVSRYFHETLSFYCGGIDNLYRHHDYTLAILESVRPYPMAKYWLHCHHLYVNGQKMSKSKGNIIYAETLLRRGFTASEIRFFLIYGHYRETLNYSDAAMRVAAERLRAFKKQVGRIRKWGQVLNLDISQKSAQRESSRSAVNVKIQDLTPLAKGIRPAFSREMDNDLNVRKAFDGVYEVVMAIDPGKLGPAGAAGVSSVLRDIDEVLGLLA